MSADRPIGVRPPPASAAGESLRIFAERSPKVRIHPSLDVLIHEYEARVKSDPQQRPNTEILKPASEQSERPRIDYNATLFLHPETNELMLIAREEDADAIDAELVQWTIKNGQLVNKRALAVKGEDPYVFTTAQVGSQGESILQSYLIYVKTELDPDNPGKVKSFRSQIAPFNPIDGAVGDPIAWGPENQKGIRVVPAEEGGWTVYLRNRTASENEDGSESVTSDIRRAHVNMLEEITPALWEKAQVILQSEGETWLGLGPSHGHKMFTHAGYHVYERKPVEGAAGTTSYKEEETLRPYCVTLTDLQDLSQDDPRVVLTAREFTEDYALQNNGEQLNYKVPVLANVVYPMESFFVPEKDEPGKFRIILISGVKDRYIGASLQPQIAELSEEEQHNPFYARRIVAQEVAESAFPLLFRQEQLRRGRDQSAAA